MTQNEFLKYTGTLSTIVTIAKNTTNLLLEITNDKDELQKGSRKERIQQILIDYIVLKTHCLFDMTRGVISLEKAKTDLAPYMKEDHLKNYIDLFEKIKNEHQSLIDRIKNNRNINGAHISKIDQLGWDEITIKKFDEAFGTGVFDAVDDEYVWFVISNFPFDEFKTLLNKLGSLVFNKLWFPGKN